MPDDDSMLGQNLVDVRNEERRARHGVTGMADPAVFLSDDPDLAMVTADPDVWQAAHPCDCDDNDGLHRAECPQA